jgi:hypothetical protein
VAVLKQPCADNTADAAGAIDSKSHPASPPPRRADRSTLVAADVLED